jgi:methylthioribose-1-phosphate isomerase
MSESTPPDIPTIDPHFERTESELIDMVVTEDGPLDTAEIEAVAAQHADLAIWMANR